MASVLNSVEREVSGAQRGGQGALVFIAGGQGGSGIQWGAWGVEVFSEGIWGISTQWSGHVLSWVDRGAMELIGGLRDISTQCCECGRGAQWEDSGINAQWGGQVLSGVNRGEVVLIGR